MKDFNRPHYHPIAPKGWMNDPNGLIYKDGWYHIFYQWNPNDSVWGNIHWGYMKTRDFNEYIHKDKILSPHMKFDKGGCFSGSALIKDDLLHLLYTGNVFLDGINEANGGPLTRQYQCLAIEDDEGFRKLNEPLIEKPPKGYSSIDFRDPKIYRDNNDYIMLLGARKDMTGEIIKYTSPDLINWTFKESLVQTDGDHGYMIECPDYFSNNKEVMTMSIMGAKRYKKRDVSGYLVKDKVYDINKFQLLDHGHFYAPQTFNNCKQTTMLGWIRMPTLDPNNHNWNGCLTLPRDLETSNHGLMIRPSKAMKLDEEIVISKDINLKKAYVFKANCHHLKFKYKTQPLTIKFKSNEAFTSYGQITIDDGIKVDLGKLNTEIALKDDCFDYTFPLEKHEMEVEIYFDHSVIEIFIGNGLYVCTLSLINNPSDSYVSIESEEVVLEAFELSRIISR